jgi:hypothetical protein
MNFSKVQMNKEIIYFVFIFTFTLGLSVIGRMVFGTVWEPYRSVWSSFIMCYPGIVFIGQYMLRKYFFPKITGNIFQKNNIGTRTPHTSTFIFYDNVLTIGCMLLGLIFWIFV